ncbi:MAG: LmeA family phospholipid-binding protein [Acidimicrobiales bacterium]|nr:LmeA family phospholipid-binding protein [Acidimicrobiales bacterium]
MSRDWFDPFGLRGSKLDPFTYLTDALMGKGLAANSAARMSTTVAKQLEGRRLDIASQPPVSLTVARLDEVRPPAGVGAVPTSVLEVPMFTAVSGELEDVHIGDVRLERIHLAARSIQMATSGDRVRVGGADYEARVTGDEVLAQIAAHAADAPMIRFDHGRIEASEGVFARWFWMELSIRAADERVVVEPVALRFRGRPVPVPRRLLQRIERDLPGLPAPLTVDSVTLDGDDVIVQGTVREVVIPVDMTRLITDLGTKRTREVLRVMVGEW